MPNTIYRTLDPLFETFLLLSASRDPDETRCETVKALDGLGFDGEQFYAAHMAVFDDYVAKFRLHCVRGDDDALFFGDSGGSLTLLLLCLLLENREHVSSVSRLTDKEINAEIMDMCQALFYVEPKRADGDSLIEFVDACPLSEGEKWKLLRIMKSPAASVQSLTDTINANVPAFEKALSKVRAPLGKLIAQYADAVAEGNMSGAFKDSLPESAEIYPSLASPVSQLVFSKTGYYGLLSALLMKPQGPDSELLLRRLKALSDASRLQILRSIREKPKYNLEIAEQLGLTAATMSHHMSVLLTCGFVGVAKQDSRVYYHLQEDALRQFIAALDQLLT